MVGSVIPYQKKYKRNPYLKTIKVPTRSNIDNASYAVRLYKATDTLFKNPINAAPIYGSSMRGREISYIDLENRKIKFPKEGLTIVFEFLVLPENKFQYRYTDPDTGKKEVGLSYEPSFAMRKESLLESSIVTYSHAKWQPNFPGFDQLDVKELAVELVMSN